MLEAAPFHLPESALSLFSATVKYKGPSSLRRVLPLTCISCPPLDCLPSNAGYIMISQGSSLHMPLFSPVWE